MDPSSFNIWLSDQLGSIIPDDRERQWILRALIEDAPQHVDSETRRQWYQQAVEHLRQGIPIAYITGKAHFFGMVVDVDKHTLIPRPETEELVDLAVKALKRIDRESGAVLDVGTGSGCIALAIKNLLPDCHVQAWDISAEALLVAKRNAALRGVSIDWLLCDALDPSSWDGLSNIDLIISNPPYIGAGEIEQMDAGVIRYEPHVALFPPGEDPLVFYRMLARMGKDKLALGGMVWCECSTFTALDVQAIFIREGYGQVEIRKDLQGLDRFCQACWKA